MDDNPYTAPRHYSARPNNAVPWTAYLGATGFLVGGGAMAAFGFYHLWVRTALAGLFWFGIGAIIAWCIVAYSRRR